MDDGAVAAADTMLPARYAQVARRVAAKTGRRLPGAGWFWRGRISFIFFWPFIAFAFALIVSGVTSFLAIDAVVRRNLLEETLPLTGDNIYSQIQRDLVPPVSISSLMAHDTFLRDWVLGGEKDTAAINRYLREIKERYGAVTAFLISDKSMNYYSAKGILARVNSDNPLDQWYFETRSIAAPYAMNVDVDTRNNGTMTIFVNHQVKDYGGRVIGVTGVGVTVDSMRKILDHYQETFRRNIYFADRNGTVILSGTDGMTLGSSIRRAPGLAMIADEVLGGTATPRPLEYSAGGVTALLNSRFIPELGWFLLVEQNEGREVWRVFLHLASSVYAAVAGALLSLVFLFAYCRRRLCEANSDVSGSATLARRAERKQSLDELVERLRASKAPISVILAAIGSVKEPDSWGGIDLGQEVVIEFRRRVASHIRPGDCVLPWGRACMAVLEGVDLEHAGDIASKLIRGLQDAPISLRGVAGDSVAAIGVGCYGSEESPEAFLARVDLALHQAMNAGGDWVEVSRP